MKKKLISFTDEQVELIQREADDREISFTEMIRRILDAHYDQEVKKAGLYPDQVGPCIDERQPPPPPPPPMRMIIEGQEMGRE
jgi:hypothetical protein